MSTMTIKLSKPIVAHGEELSELTLEEPTLGALDKVHVVADGEGTVKIDSRYWDGKYQLLENDPEMLDLALGALYKYDP